jgi:hypothetical protein
MAVIVWNRVIPVRTESEEPFDSRALQGLFGAAERQPRAGVTYGQLDPPSSSRSTRRREARTQSHRVGGPAVVIDWTRSLTDARSLGFVKIVLSSNFPAVHTDRVAGISQLL